MRFESVTAGDDTGTARQSDTHPSHHFTEVRVAGLAREPRERVIRLETPVIGHNDQFLRTRRCKTKWGSYIGSSVKPDDVK
jgi:hypothetical protein